MRCDDLLAKGKCSDINLQFDVFVFISKAECAEASSVNRHNDVSFYLERTHGSWEEEEEEAAMRHWNDSQESKKGLNEICELPPSDERLISAVNDALETII